jgi:hypothetical protein
MALISVLYSISDHALYSKSHTTQRQQGVFWSYPKSMFPRGWKLDGSYNLRSIFSLFSSTTRGDYQKEDVFSGPSETKQKFREAIQQKFDSLKSMGIVYKFKIRYINT